MIPKVLIVEDDPSYAEFLEVSVRAAGYAPHVAHDGEEALRSYAELSPDLVLLDLLVPRRDGHAVCEAIRAAPGGASVPVVVLTGIYKKKEYREAMRTRFEVYDYMVKPVPVVDLWQVLHRYLDPGAGVGTVSAEEAPEALPEPTDDPFSGVPVGERPLPILLHELLEERRTGLVFLKDDRKVLILYVDGGEIVFARSNDPEDRLTSRLVRHGVLAEEDAREVEDLVAQGPEGVRMGEVLVGMDLMDCERLEAAVREQLEDLVLEAFRTNRWRARFVEGDLPDEETIRIERSTPALILAGVREIQDLDVIRPHLPGPGCRPTTRPRSIERAEELGLTPYEERMLRLCDGTRTLRKIVGIAKLAPVEIERILYAFLHTGLVEAVPGEEDASPRPRAPSTRATAEIPEEGLVEETPVAEIVLRLYDQGRSGVLRLEQEEARAWMYFDQGALVFAGNNDESSRIGEVLVECRLVEEETLREIAAAAREDGRETRLGQRCVEEGHLSLEELSWAVTFQVQKRVQAIFSWSRGRWTFTEEPLPTDEPVTLGFSTVDVVLEAVRRMDPAVVAAHLPDPATGLRRSDDVSLAPRLPLEERRLLEQIGDGTSVERFLANVDGEADFLRRSLYGFLLTGVVECVSEGEMQQAEEESLEREAEDAMGFLDRGPKPAPKPAANGDLVPRVLLHRSQARQQEMQEQMHQIYESYAGLQALLAGLKDEISMLRESPLLDRLDPELRALTVGIFDEYLARIGGAGKRKKPAQPGAPEAAEA